MNLRSSSPEICKPWYGTYCPKKIQRSLQTYFYIHINCDGVILPHFKREE
jgi:hypothetical protein